MLAYFDIEWNGMDGMGGVGRRHRGALPNLFHVRLVTSAESNPSLPVVKTRRDANVRGEGAVVDQLGQVKVPVRDDMDK